MGLRNRYILSQMVRPVQFYLSVRALIYDLDNALLWSLKNQNWYPKKDLTSVIVKATPSCKFILRTEIIIFSLNTELHGKYIG